MKKRNRIRAFTLAELMIASAILLIAILGLLAAYINFMLINEYNQHRMVAFNDAQYVLEQARSQAYTDLDDFINNYNTNPNQFNNLNNERVAIPTFTYDLRITDITVRVTWNERGNDKNIQLSTKIARSKQ